MVQIEDALITGVLREKIGVELAAMEPPTWLGWAWHTVLSQCPWMTITKLTFSNNLGRNPRLSTIWIMEGIFRIIASFACHKINGSYFSDWKEKFQKERAVRGTSYRATRPEVLHVSPHRGGTSGFGTSCNFNLDSWIYLGNLSEMINWIGDDPILLILRKKGKAGKEDDERGSNQE